MLYFKSRSSLGICPGVPASADDQGCRYHLLVPSHHLIWTRTEKQMSLDVSAQIPAILKGDKSVGTVVLHAGMNDTKLRQTETLKRDFRSLIETVRSTSPAMTINVPGRVFPCIDEDTKGSVNCLLKTIGCCHGVNIINCSVLIIGIFSGSVLGFSMRMACTGQQSRSRTPVGQHLQDATLHLTSITILK